MKRFLKNIQNALADAALMEMGVSAEHSTGARNFPPVQTLKTAFNRISDSLSDAALLEMGGFLGLSPTALRRSFSEAFEENMVEVAFAEAADYDDIHEALLKEHREPGDIIHPDECQYGDNDLCFTQ